MKTKFDKKNALDVFTLPHEPFGKGDTERCIEIPWAMSVFAGEKRVLDVGYTNAENRYVEQILSLNISELHGIDIVEKKVDGFITHLGDIRITDFQDDFFDLVYCISTIEHIGRDNTIYDEKSCENDESGDIKALKEIHRITRNGGRVVLTVPFGKYHNYGWFIHYDDKRWEQLLSCVQEKIIKEDFFIYNNGWHHCNKADLKETLYQDNNAPAAAGLVCVLLEKNETKNNTREKVHENIEDNMDTFEIRDDEIDVEKIMEKIRENIRKRNGSERALNVNSESSRHNLSPEGLIEESNVQRDLDYINSNWEINNNSYFISSHRPFVGKFLVKGRETVHGEIRRYVDPMIWKQSGFNDSVVRLLNNANNRLNSFYTKIDQLRPEIDTKIDQLRPEIDTKIDKLRLEINKNIDLIRLEFLEKIMTEIDMVISSTGSETNNKEYLSILESKIEEDIEYQKTIFSEPQNLEMNYLNFENKFRGSSEDIKGRQSKFMDYFAGCSNVLDIGSGRGEFLELAKEQGIGAKGVDIDDDMVSYCLTKELDVEKNDAIQYLEKIDDNSLGGIFIDQVVEHLESDYLIKLLALCYQKLMYGSYLLIETVNPLSLTSFANFYIDITHKKPVHPATLQFLLESSSFKKIEIQYLSPVCDDSKLKLIPNYENVDEVMRESITIYNHNVGMLNNILYGPQDYAVIGIK